MRRKGLRGVTAGFRAPHRDVETPKIGYMFSFAHTMRPRHEAMSAFHAIGTVVFPALLRLAPVRYGRSSLGRRLTRHCRGHLGLRSMKVTLAGGHAETMKPHVVGITLGRNRIGIRCDDGLILQRPNEVFHRIAGVLAVVARVSSFRSAILVADISDGEDSEAGLISFCSREPEAILIPDHVFIRTRGYETERALARSSITDWDERSDRIVWRGSTTGAGRISKLHLSAQDPELIARVRLCLALKDVPGTDVKLSGIAQSADRSMDSERLARAGILGEFVSPICWHGFKFAIDIDGNSNAWSNFFTRLLMGCCVIKVASAAGYQQWYYGDIEPWTHYVPVKADLSDLHEIIGWCRAHPAECRRIAAQGQAFAMARDFDTEMASARERVCRAFAGGRVSQRPGSWLKADTASRLHRAALGRAGHGD